MRKRKRNKRKKVSNSFVTMTYISIFAYAAILTSFLLLHYFRGTLGGLEVTPLVILTCCYTLICVTTQVIYMKHIVNIFTKELGKLNIKELLCLSVYFSLITISFFVGFGIFLFIP